jgi:hypothetical protein
LDISQNGKGIFKEDISIYGRILAKKYAARYGGIRNSRRGPIL